MNIGKIKWYGGWNSQKNCYNQYGFLEITSCDQKGLQGEVLYFNREGISSDSKLTEETRNDDRNGDKLKDYLVVFDIQKGRERGKQEATNVRLIFELPAACFVQSHSEIVESLRRVNLGRTELILGMIPSLSFLEKEKVSAVMEACTDESTKEIFVSLLPNKIVKANHLERYEKGKATSKIQSSPQTTSAARKKERTELSEEVINKLIARCEYYGHLKLENMKNGANSIGEELTLYKDKNGIQYVFKYTPKEKFENVFEIDRSISKAIWAYKDCERDIVFKSVFDTFTKYLMEAVEKIAVERNAKNIALVNVPRSSSKKPKPVAESIKIIVAELNKKSRDRCYFDETDLLVRRVDLARSSHSSSKSEERNSFEDHIASIELRTTRCPTKTLYILIDDVATKGDTMLACRSIISRVATSVEMLVIAKTSASAGNNDRIVWKIAESRECDANLDFEDEIEKLIASTQQLRCAK